MKNAIKISALATLVAAFITFSFNPSFSQADEKPVKCEDCTYGYKKLGQKLFFKETTKLDFFGKKKFPSHKGPFSYTGKGKKKSTAGDVFLFSGHALVWNCAPSGEAFLVKIPASLDVLKDDDGNVFADICNNRIIFEARKKEKTEEKTEEKKDTVFVEQKEKCCHWHYARNGDVMIDHVHPEGSSCACFIFDGARMKSCTRYLDCNGAELGTDHRHPNGVECRYLDEERQRCGARFVFSARFRIVSYRYSCVYRNNVAYSWVYAPGFNTKGPEAQSSCGNPYQPKYKQAGLNDLEYCKDCKPAPKCGKCGNKSCGGGCGKKWKEKNGGQNGTYNGPRTGGTKITTGKSAKTQAHRKQTTTIKRGRN